jgi:hypothetical protein
VPHPDWKGDQHQRAALPETIRLLLRYEAAIDRRANETCCIETTAVIGDRDDGAVAALFDSHADRARSLLARLLAFRGGFETMVERVANEVRQGIYESLEQRAIESDVTPGHLEAGGFAQRGRELSHGSREPVGDGLEGNQTQLEGPGVEVPKK